MRCCVYFGGAKLSVNRIVDGLERNGLCEPKHLGIQIPVYTFCCTVPYAQFHTNAQTDDTQRHIHTHNFGSISEIYKNKTKRKNKKKRRKKLVVYVCEYCVRNFGVDVIFAACVLVNTVVEPFLCFAFSVSPPLVYINRFSI